MHRNSYLHNTGGQNINYSRPAIESQGQMRVKPDFEKQKSHTLVPNCPLAGLNNRPHHYEWRALPLS